MQSRLPVLAFLSVLLTTISATAGDFGISRWGEGEAALRARANGQILQEMVPEEGSKALFMNDRIADLDVFLIYLYSQNNLVQTKYLFAQNHLKPELFLSEYARVEQFLRQRYGNPVESGQVWVEGGGTADRSDVGRMIAIGQLTLKTRWETEDTIITHVLRGESLDVDHEINFVSREYGKAGGREMNNTIRPPRGASL